ncbi:MAG: transposase [Janthinobacterium lividum]
MLGAKVSTPGWSIAGFVPSPDRCYVRGADTQDPDEAKVVLKRSRARHPFVKHVFADGGYAARLIDWAKKKTNIALQIIQRNASTKGFEILSRRRVVETTFAWIITNRRFVRDYEQLTTLGETLIIIAATVIPIRR